MSASDWIAVSSAGIALLAFVVGARALQLQRAAAADDARQEFDELVHKLGRALAKSFAAPVPGQTGGEPPVDISQAMADVQTLALQADGLLKSSQAVPPPGWRRWLRQVRQPSSPPLELDWNEAVVLATSFGQVWDTDRARDYWSQALTLCTRPDAQVGPSAQITTLRSNAIFCYLGNSDADLKQARDGFDRARRILKPEINGVDLTNDQKYWLSFQQAQQEDQLGNTEEAVMCLREAWETIGKVGAKWRCDRAKHQLGWFIAYAGDPNRFSADGALPEGIREMMAGLQAQDQAPAAQQQALNLAWQQGFNAAQHLAPQPHPATSLG